MKKQIPGKTTASRAGMASAKRTDVPPASCEQSGIFFTCLFVAVFVFITNLIWPKNYELLAWGYLSFYPLWMQVVWFLGIVGVLWGARWMMDRPRIKTGWVWSAAVTGVALAGLALIFWRTRYPGLVGDGESLRVGGGYYHDWGVIPRWPIMIAHGLAACFLQGDVVTAWWIMETGYGFLYIGLAALIAWHFRSQPWVAVGLLFWMLGTPVLMNAGGHFDSLASVLVTGTLWWMALWKFDRSPGWGGLIRWGLILLLIAVIAANSTPVNHALSILTVAVCGLRGIRLLGWTRFWRFSTFLAVPMLGIGLVVGLSLFGGQDSIFFFPVKRAGVDMPLMRGEYLWYFIRSNVWLFLNIALPSAVLGIWALVRRRGEGCKPWDEVQAVSVAGFLAAWWFHVATMQGINDETAFAPAGMIALGSAGLLFLRDGTNRAQAGILFVGILALALQVPRLALYTSPRFIERYEKLYPHDRCAFNNQMSPYVHLGLMLHPYDDYAREARLRVFRDGANTTLPYWGQFRLSNMMYYTAWCYEYRRDEEGRAALRTMLKVAPGNVPYLVSPGTMFTHRHKNQAYPGLRRDVKILLDTEFGSPGSSPIYRQLRQYLKEVESQPVQDVPPSFWSGDALKPLPTDNPLLIWYKKTAQGNEKKMLQWYFQQVEDSQKQGSKSKIKVEPAP